MARVLHPVRLDFYPERQDPDDDWLHRAETIVSGNALRLHRAVQPLRDRILLRAITRAGRPLASLSEPDMSAEIRAVRTVLRRGGLRRRSIVRSLAVVREVSHRVLGLRHHDVQIRGGLAMLRGALAEMDTGEGKTITACLAAATAALAGMPVHVITVNSYLAERDRDTLAAVYDRLGLTHAVITEDLQTPERQAVYACDIVYGANNEFAFDYLRDQLVFGDDKNDLRRRLRRLVGSDTLEQRLVLRGLHFAIVDEADSVLVDEARTPLIISRQSDPEDERAWSKTALQLAKDMIEGTHYKLRREDRRIELTDTGRKFLATWTQGLGARWHSAIRREETARQALSAILLFEKGDQYLVVDDKVQIVDEYTGRVQPDRSWSDGLHQLVEAKEGVPITPQNLSIARMTYQRLFRRYKMLSGMTGTAREARAELWTVFRLDVNRIPPNRPSRLRFRRPRVYRTAEAKWVRLVAETKAEIARGRPVLVGTRSVGASEQASAALTVAGIEHRVLNATNDTEEAEIIAQAGSQRRVTVATNMAGRGVDIALDPSVVAAGGLHVILTERHDAGRIDRQLAGRAGRRGEPGSVSVLLSLEDELLKVLRAPVRKTLAQVPVISQALRLKLFDQAQRTAERAHARARKDLVRQDKRLNAMLSFTGGLE
jgi:preprotein translocase subunit SecA